MSMAYILRPAADDDYDFLYTLHRATMRSAVEATWGWDEEFQRQRFQAHFEPEASQIIVVAGAAVGVLKLEERDGDCFVGLVEITPAWQGQGLGSEVMRDVLAEAFGRGQAVSLHVLKANPAARRLYERLGFRVVETREERYVMRCIPPATKE